ncbi:MAG: LPXTG cell wall anchor domain-containing protein [Microbacterium sp.]|nr:LPXTG cell wall anchor domain-containing protein [Microbacterium sp.]
MEDCLAATGPSGTAAILAVGALLVLAGAAAVVVSMRRRGARGAFTVALAGALLLGTLGIAAAPSGAHASTNDCETASPAPTTPTAAPTPEPTPVETTPATPPVAIDDTAYIYSLGWMEQTDPASSPAPFTVNHVYAYTLDVLATARATAPAALDPATVDLDPSSAGIQQSISSDGITASVDPVTGVITVTGSMPLGTTRQYEVAYPEAGGWTVPVWEQPIHYTVTDSNGVVSNVATITIDHYVTRLPQDA